MSDSQTTDAAREEIEKFSDAFVEHVKGLPRRDLWADSTFFLNPQLSLKSKALLFTILCLDMHGTGKTETTIEQLAALSRDGKTAVATGLTELLATGFLRRERLHDDEFGFYGFAYHINLGAL